MKELEHTTQSVPKGKRYCTICGEVKRLHYFEGNSTHCSACCEKMRHTHLNARYIPFVLVLLVVLAASVFLFVQTVPTCSTLVRARQATQDNCLSDACALYYTAITDAAEKNAALLSGGQADDSGSLPTPTWTFFTPGAYTWARYLHAYALLNSEYEAAGVAQSSLDKQTSSLVPAIADLYRAQQDYDETLAFAEQIESAYPFEGAENMPYDEIIADLASHADESDSRFVKGYIEYYKGMATKFYKADDPAASAVFFEKMLDYLPDEFMIVYSTEAENALAAEKYDLAIEAYEKILERNKNYTGIYPSIAEAAFLGGDEEKLASVLARYDEDDPLRLQLEMWFALRSDDLDKAAAVREKARQTVRVEADTIFNKMLADQSIDDESRTLLLNYMGYALEEAALALVQGDKDEAYRVAYEEVFNYAYYYAFITNNSDGLTQSVVNMATLCASLVGDQDALKTIKEVGPCDATTQQMIDGELTAREVFVEGKADIL